MSVNFNWASNPAILDRCIELKNAGNCTIGEITEVVNKEFGIKLTHDQLRGKLNRVRLGGGDVASDNSKTTSQYRKFDTPIILLNREIQSWKLRYNKLESQVQNSAEFFITQMGDFRVQPVKIPKSAGKRLKHTMNVHAMFSDVQYGELIVPEQTMGLGEFNAEICKKRLWKYVERIIHFKEEDHAAHGLDNLIIWNLGDLMEGFTVYEGQAYYIDRGAIEQVLEFTEIKVGMILELCKHFTTVEEFCIAGNHPRLTKKKHVLPYKNNFDYLSNAFSKQMLRDQSNYECFISESPRMVVKCGEFNFCLQHGDQIQSWMGVPYYGMKRDAKNLSDLTQLLIHYALYGDKHTATNLGNREIMNGCVPGGSELSINRMGITSPPSQKMWYFHDVNGINREINVILDKPRELVVDDQGIYTPWK